MTPVWHEPVLEVSNVDKGEEFSLAAGNADTKKIYPGNHVILEVQKKQQPLSKNKEKLDFDLIVKELFLLYFIRQTWEHPWVCFV